LQARVAKELLARDDGEGEPAKALGDLDSDPAWVLAVALPGLDTRVVVVVAVNEVVGGLHENATQPSVAAAPQGTVGQINAVALVTGRGKAGAAGNAVGIGVEAYGAELAGQI